jgi:Transposase-associated domain
MDRSRWMYGVRRDTFQYLRGVEEFLNHVIENMRQRGHHTVLCLYRDCQNVCRFQNVEEIRNHLIRRGFKEWYTRWVWHGESYDERSTNAGTSVGFVADLEDISNDKSSGENIEKLDDNQNVDNDNQNIDNDNQYLDGMIQDVPLEFVEIPKKFENLCNESNVPLFPSCTKFTKITVVLKLYNLKAKNY